MADNYESLLGIVAKNIMQAIRKNGKDVSASHDHRTYFTYTYEIKQLDDLIEIGLSKSKDEEGIAKNLAEAIALENKSASATVNISSLKPAPFDEEMLVREIDITVPTLHVHMDSPHGKVGNPHITQPGKSEAISY